MADRERSRSRGRSPETPPSAFGPWQFLGAAPDVAPAAPATPTPPPPAAAPAAPDLQSTVDELRRKVAILQRTLEELQRILTQAMRELQEEGVFAADRPADQLPSGSGSSAC